MKCLDVDLNQMFNQRDVLTKRGISVIESGGIPMVHSSDYERSLRIIWNDKIEGWWNYRNDLISLGICTEEEYKEKIMMD